MQLISLNIWGGHVYEPLLNFIKNNQKIDFFCFQEVYDQAKKSISTEDRLHALNIFTELKNLLPGHIGYFRPVVNDIYGIAMFVKNEIAVAEEGEIIIHENEQYIGAGPTHMRNMQWVKCVANNQEFYVCNLHGLWNGQGKLDSSSRVAQSKAIKQFLNQTMSPKIVCGDFNLIPETESMRIIDADMNNLIKIHNIQSTRTSYYTKAEKFADYIITCDSVKINKFEILSDVVSDHAPLFLNFDIM